MDTKRALVIAHEADGPGGQVAVRLRERGFDIDTHVVTPDHEQPNRANPFPDFADYDLIAIMGSIRSLTEKEAIDTWVFDELDRIREAHDRGQPMLGICFGGQLLSEALGGSVERSPITEIGWHEVRATAGQANPAGPGPWMQWHHDRFTPPPEATVLAENDAATQMFVMNRTVGTQFHPEVDREHIVNWLATADDEYLNEWGQDRDDLIASIEANEARNIVQCHAFVDWYLDTVAFAEPADAAAAVSS